MANLSGEAIFGENGVPYREEISSLAKSVGDGEPEEKVKEARDALAKVAGNDHAVLDTAGIVGFFASITKIVDFSGHYSDDIMKMVDRMSNVLSGARRIRQTLCCCFLSTKKEKPLDCYAQSL
jgi:hypothetical protein